ncbi:MAG: HEAT repeat domain-containing protein, partial [Bacillota bacterium]
MHHRSIRSFAALIALIVIASLVISFSAANVRAQQEMLLADAISNGLVRAEIKGAGLAEIDVRLVRQANQSITIAIPAGTFFVNRGAALNMVAVKNTWIDLSAKSEARMMIPSAGTNMYKRVPDSSFSFDVRQVPEPKELARLCKHLAIVDISIPARQIAVWIITDDPARNEIDKTYIIRRQNGTTAPAASNEEILQAMKAVEQAGINAANKKLFKEKISAIRGLASADKDIAEYALRLLGFAGREPISVLVTLLGDEAQGIRAEAANGLKKAGPAALEYLLLAANGMDTTIALEAIRLLAGLEGAHVIQALKKATTSTNPAIRMEAVRSLSGRTGTECINILRPLLQDSDAAVRKIAAESLQKLRWRPENQTEEAWFLIALLRTEECAALGRSAVEPLIKVLHDSEASVRLMAVRALGLIADERA